MSPVVSLLTRRNEARWQRAHRRAAGTCHESVDPARDRHDESLALRKYSSCHRDRAVFFRPRAGDDRAFGAFYRERAPLLAALGHDPTLICRLQCPVTPPRTDGSITTV